MCSSGQRHGFAAAQAAADQQGEQGAIPFSLEGGRVGAVDERLGLRPGQPVPCPDSLLLDPGHLVDGGGHRGIEQPVGGRLARQFLDGGQALVDGRGRVALALECGAVGLDGGAGEGRTSLLRPPGEEIGERLAVHGARAGARDGVEDQPHDRIERGRRRVRNEGHQTGSTQTAQAAGFSWDWTGRWTRPVGCSARRRSK